MGKEIVNQIQESQRIPYRIKLKEKHAETHASQTNKYKIQRKNI